MVDPLAELVAASVAFVGSHFAMSHPLRSAMVRLFKPLGFTLVYAVISFATLFWMVQAFGMRPRAHRYGRASTISAGSSLAS